MLVFIVYDGIHHSIFEGQVLAPLLKRLTAGTHNAIHIVSFEESITPAVITAHKKFSALHPRITITLLKRPRFIAQSFLWQQSWELKKILNSTSESYELYARGPLAGIIARQAITDHCISLTIQARGLLAQEHAYTHQHTTGIHAILMKLRRRQLYSLEKSAYYQPQQCSIPFFIEAVSPALKTYLIDTYGIPEHSFTVPLFDHPEVFSQEEKQAHRKALRAQLTIPDDASVFVYNGSLKAWQCPQETIALFKEQFIKNKNSIFLALTQDQLLMQQLLEQADIPAEAYRILHVSQAEVLFYLCTADFGILLREPHPLNWVSRPTKLLEYQAAGLEIVHNNTIELLAHNKKAAPIQLSQ